MLPHETISVKEMRVLELNSYLYGVTTRLLMESAGAAVAQVIRERFRDGLHDMRVKVVLGKGGKAGDGLVCARHLTPYVRSVEVVMVYETLGHKDAQENLNIIKSMGSVKITKFKSGIDLSSDIIIDGLLGIGVKGVVREPIKSVIERLNRSSGFKVSIDVPSGIDPDTGEVLGVAVKADLTVTLHKVKLGLLKAKDYVGELVVANIGVPVDAELCVGPGDVVYRVKQKPVTAKKGDGGRVLVIAGSKDYIGAPWLTALASWYAGADIVWLAAPYPVFTTRFSPEIIPVMIDEPYISPKSIENMSEHMAKTDVVVIGPGLSLKNPYLTDTVIKIIDIALAYSKPLVIDADALKVLHKVWEERGLDFKGKAVLTPHLGEATYLLNKSLGNMVEDRIKAAIEISKKYNVITVLKGYQDVIAEPSGKYRLRRGIGHQDMSRGGTGDVLSGVIAGLVRRTDNLFDAALAATFINSLSGELAYMHYGMASPLKMLKFIPRIIKDPVDMIDELFLMKGRDIL